MRRQSIFVLAIVLILSMLSEISEAVEYERIFLEKLPGHDSAIAYAINNNGQVVGRSYDYEGSSCYHGFLWNNGVVTDLGCAEAYGINDSTQVVGQAGHAFLWENGVMIDLGVSVARAINNKGQIVGGWSSAWLYDGGQITDLGALFFSGKRSRATAINNNGQIVGYSYDIGSNWATSHAFLYDNGTVTDLGTLGGDYSLAWEINDYGQIVGRSSTTPGQYNEHAFLYENGTMIDLGQGSAEGINNNGQVAGWTDRWGGRHGFLYENGVMIDLGTGTPLAINDHGWIVGLANHLWVPESTLLPVIDGYINWVDLAGFADRWLDNCCSVLGWCGSADLNRDRRVDFTDFTLLAQYWLEVVPVPGSATNPSPGDMATNVSITADLSWTAGPNTILHDVYFGTTSPGTFQGHQSDTTFDPGTLDAGTTYYWQIDEVGLGGTTLGIVWSFTTAPAPGPASNPNPSDMATDVSETIDLSWTTGSNATSHDVYFGTNPMPDVNEFQGNQTDTTFDPGTLDYEITYYWRIDEVGPGGRTSGSVWSFTTMIDPNLIGRWEFNETSGNIAYDSSGNENHGMLINGLGEGLVWVPSESALNFDGSNNQSRVVISTTGMFTTVGTIAIWANLAEPQIRGGGRKGSGYFFGCDNGGIDKILLYMDNSDTQLDIKVGNRSGNNIMTLITETWYHIALTWHRGIYTVYVNGSEMDTGSYGGLSSLPSTADIGNNGDSSTQSFHGLMGDILIFDKSLSATEIQQLYQHLSN